MCAYVQDGPNSTTLDCSKQAPAMPSAVYTVEYKQVDNPPIPLPRPKPIWHSGGKKMQEGYFCSGQQCSNWTQWWDNGNLRSEVVWQSGKINGSVTNYFPNGHKAVTGQANQDKKVGEWTWWDNEGNVIVKKNLTK